MNLLLTIFVLAVLISASVAGISAAPWLPTKPSQRRHLLSNLELKDGMTIIDLGCGDGSMLFALARKNPNVHSIGYDISLLPLLFGWIRKLLRPFQYRNVHIRFGNLFTQNIASADVLFVFLLAKSYPKLIEKFRNELSEHTQVIVEAWPMPDIEPIKTLKEEGLLPVYIYSAKAFRDKA